MGRDGKHEQREMGGGGRGGRHRYLHRYIERVVPMVSKACALHATHAESLKQENAMLRKQLELLGCASARPAVRRFFFSHDYVYIGRERERDRADAEAKREEVIERERERERERESGCRSYVASEVAEEEVLTLLALLVQKYKY
jgi:hypothetical protein